MECRNYDCKNILSEYDLKKIKSMVRVKQSKHNYCVKCRRTRSKISRFECYFCKKIIPFTFYSHYTCKNCSSIRRAKQTRKCYLKNRVLIGKTKYISKCKKLEKILENGTYSNTELCKMIHTTRNSLKVMLSSVNKITPIKYGYTLKA
jgi:hypothetical protein